MIQLELAIEIHSVLIKRYGGKTGIRDQALLESALERPYQTFDGAELYPSTVDKASAIIESIVKNHPFLDGNKRTGYVLMRLMLRRDKIDIKATQDQKYEFVIQIASGKVDFEKIKTWLNEKITPLSD